MFYKLLNAYTRQFPFPQRGLKYFLKIADKMGIADKSYIKRLPDNFLMQLNPTEHIQQQLFWYGYYEKALGDILKKIIKPGGVFIDIGANIGYFSLLIANNVPTAKVISFEPARDIFLKLKENISINNIKNITPFNAAIGEMNEEKELFISGADNLGMSSFQQPENFSGKKEIVQVLTIDDWFKRAGLAKIDVIKLDVEGSELSALKGMSEVLQSFKPMVIVEINPETLAMFGLKSATIHNYLDKFNFKGFIISEAGELTKIGENEINETVNVLYAHNEKMELLSSMVTSH
jgi:FkbM family methyltransferase